MTRRALLLSALCTALSAFECIPEFACDNGIACCGAGSECINPSGAPLGGCCVPQGLSLEDDDGFPSEFVKTRCGVDFACDNEMAECWSHSQCVNPSSAPLGGCCIPKDMDAEEWLNESEQGANKKTSAWEHLRGIVADYVIENCGPAYACDGIYGCSDHSQCLNPSGESLSGCCIPKGMDPAQVESGQPLPEELQEGPSDARSLRGLIAEYVAENCGAAFACDGTYGCGEDSLCINPSGEALSGCCVPEGMTAADLETAVPSADPHPFGSLNGIDLRSIVHPYVLDNCGPAFACDSIYGCSENSECINPFGETLSGCCVPEGMTRADLEGADESAADPEIFFSLNGIDLRSIMIDPFVREHCGLAFACDNIAAGCGEGAECVNPSAGLLSGCCVPKGLKIDTLEASKDSAPEMGEYGFLNGIDLKSLIAPYVLANCGPSFACDEIGAFCSSHSECINPSAGPLAGCCVPKGMTREELESGHLVPRGRNDSESEQVGDEEREAATASICAASVGQCIPTVFMANETKFREEL